MGDNVAEGVNVGVRVIAAVWELARSVGAATAAVLVRADIIVCAMAVSRVLASGVEPVTGMVGRPQARERTNKTVTDKRIGVGFRMEASFRLTGPIITSKARRWSAKRGTSVARGLFPAI